jgi:hypothetical protein
MAFQTTLTPELIERYTDQRYWLGRTITDYLDEAAERTTLLLVHHCDTLRVPLQFFCADGGIGLVARAPARRDRMRYGCAVSAKRRSYGTPERWAITDESRASSIR